MSFFTRHHLELKSYWYTSVMAGVQHLYFEHHEPIKAGGSVTVMEMKNIGMAMHENRLNPLELLEKDFEFDVILG